MSNIQTGAERMPHDLSHLGFLAGQIGRLITISTTPVIAGDSFEMDAVGALRLSPLRRGLAIDSKKRDEIEAGKSYCSRRFGGATCDDKSAQIYARFDKNDWRIQPAEFYRFHDAEVNTFGYF